MFSRKTLMIVGVVVVIFINIFILSVTVSRHPHSGPGSIAVSLVAPFQHVLLRVILFVENVWTGYFDLINVAKENRRLNAALHRAVEERNQLREIELANERLRRLLDFKQSVSNRVVAAEVIAKDPSPWFKSVLIDKGRIHGVDKGMPVVISQGVVGQVTEVAPRYAKVLLIVDQNSAVDAIVQPTRARGIVTGAMSQGCVFKYVLRKHEVRVGDTVVSSGLDGVFPKGLRVGQVTGVVRRSSGIFQEIEVAPYVDFEKLEEVLIILNPPVQEFLNVP
jgi:rod shape-determining protein MreC